MFKVIVCVIAVVSAAIAASGQSYAPAPGNPGSTALPNNSPLFTAWATGITVTRGYVKISDPAFTAAGSNFASSGQPGYAVGPANGGSVSLGDGGYATLTFATPMTNGEGFDFAVFETGSADYIELAFVEVSSDGVYFFRFPNHSETQATNQIGTFGSPQPQYLNNLAGKYNGIYGTPFDLSDLPDDALLDKNRVTHIRVIDVVGSIDPDYASYDSFGNAVNDSFPTPFNTSGFDLMGVGVIHQATMGTDNQALAEAHLYPNPTTGIVYIDDMDNINVIVYDTTGKIVITLQALREKINLSGLAAGLYFVELASGDRRAIRKMVKL